MRGIPVGEARALFWVYSKTGIQAGVFTGTQTTLAHNASSGAYVLDTIYSSAFNYAPATDVQIEGGDKVVAAPMFGNPRLIPFDNTCPDVDDALVTLIQQSVSNTVNSYYTKYGYNSNRATPNAQVGMAVQQRFELTSGLSYYVTRMIPKLAATMHPGGATYRGKSDTIIHVSPITGTLNYDGQVYGSSGLNFQWEQDRGDYWDLVSAEPVHIVAFRGDSTNLIINPPYRPLSSVVTLNATPNEMTKVPVATGLAALTALSAVTTGAAATMTLAAAGADLDLYVTTYQTAFVPV